MGQIGPAIVTIIAGVIGLAIVAVIVSQRAQTPQVFQAGGTALSQIIGAAVSPVTGSTNTFGAAGQTVAGTSG